MAKYAQGKYTVKNKEKYLGNRQPTYRSSWEFAFMKFCDEHPSVAKWASEAIKIPYRNPFTGKQTIYVPDFFVVYVDRTGKQHVEVVEVKPYNQTVKEKARSKHNQAHWALNQVKWAAANAYCKQNGMKFRVVSENDIFHSGRRG
jgi:hypothetical protein